MKRYPYPCPALPFLSSFLPSFSQSTVDTTTYFICAELLGAKKFLSEKVNIEIDFGQSRKWFSNQKFIVDPETGNLRTFNSMVDAMKFMGENDWEFLQAYVVTEGNQNVYHRLLKRACRGDEKGEYIPLTLAEYVKRQRALVVGN